MWVFRWCSRRHTHPGSATGPGCYRSASYSPLRPWQVRGRRFGRTGFGRRGLDAAEVHDFLDRVAGDLAAVYAALATSRDETARIKDALRRWQSDQAWLTKNQTWPEIDQTSLASERAYR